MNAASAFPPPTRQGGWRRAIAVLACVCAGAPSAACETGAFILRGDFPGARLGICGAVGEREVALRIEPEDGGRINPSPWYAFHVRARSPNAGELRVRLDYGKHQHRYWPKTSADGKAWRRLPEAQVQSDEGRATLRLAPDVDGLYVAAQENLNEAFYNEWREGLAAADQWQVIGQSRGGRPLHALFVNPDAPNYILLLGRQHPPEVTGTLAFMRFVERLLEDRAACSPKVPRCRFFANHGFAIVPLMNPDGVARGHWRHNLGQTDLNRDWGPFTQPETQAVRDFVEAQEVRRRRLRLVLDFHSTRRNVFYVQDDASPTRPRNFAANWLDAAKARDELYEVELAPRDLSALGTAKNYFYRRFGVPSITYEVADEEHRQRIAATATALADALVDVLNTADAAAPKCEDSFCHLAAANMASLVMLAEEGLLSSTAASEVADAIAWIVEEQQRPGAERSANYLDFEARLIELAGVGAANLHLGRSRQDLHGTVRRLLTRDRWLAAVRGMVEGRRHLLALAASEAQTPVPAYTHGVQAQPTTFGHYLLAYSAALARDAARAREGWRRLNRSPLGAAALGTSGFPLNRARLAQLLGFDAPLANSYDANLVSSADYKLEFAHVLSQSAVAVGQFAQNLHTQYHDPQPWLLLRPEAVSGSSIMPQKRNPRPIDRLRSTASEVLGQAHGLALLAHNANAGMHDYRQIRPLLQLAATGELMYRRYVDLIDAIEVDAARALEELHRGYSTMTEVADVLVREAAVPFRVAHGYASALTDLCRAAGKRAGALTDDELRDTYQNVVGEPLPVAPQVVRAALDPAQLIAGRRGFGGLQPAEMQRALTDHHTSLAADERWLHEVERGLEVASLALREAFEQRRAVRGRAP